MVSLSYRQKRLLSQTIMYAVAAIIMIYCLFPIAWIFITSIKPPGAEFHIPIEYIPSKVSLDNYIEIFVEHKFHYYLLNSLVVASATTILVLAIGSLSAYAIARLRFKFRISSLLTILVVGMMPSIVMILPIFLIIRELGLMNTWLGLIITHAVFSLPITVWLLASYFAELPFDLEDAAKIDGYTPSSIYRKIIMPLSVPGLFSAGILAFIASWGEFMFALTLTHTIQARTALVLITTLPGAYHLKWGMINAGVILTLIPIIVIVLVFQKWVMRGLTAGAVKY
ncbi:MAG: carbohydrate ABC transporter permease [Candidatus Bathyarchaeota archaeon]|nr:carbohydrate ABC transporter permease [Candidatus Bathyarchaeota archaeon]MDH5746709.1 carbohydrate ABC transporter permease [Candidatus Bathyarchaeota archaeon]